MTCLELLLYLLTCEGPERADQSEIQLAIDLLSRELPLGVEEIIVESREWTRKALVELLNDHPHLRAASLGDEIHVRRLPK